MYSESWLSWFDQWPVWICRVWRNTRTVIVLVIVTSICQKIFCKLPKYLAQFLVVWICVLIIFNILNLITLNWISRLFFIVTPSIQRRSLLYILISCIVGEGKNQSYNDILQLFTKYLPSYMFHFLYLDCWHLEQVWAFHFHPKESMKKYL